VKGDKLEQHERVALTAVLSRLATAQTQLQFVRDQELTDEARNGILALTTRQVIDDTNELRDAFGFDTIEREEERSETGFTPRDPNRRITYFEMAQADVLAILDAHADELAERLVKWSRDSKEPLDIANTIPGADAWVHEEHALSNMSIGIEVAARILLEIPEEYHETDRSIWLYETCYKTVVSCGVGSYAHCVAKLMAQRLDAMREDALGCMAERETDRLTAGQARKIVQAQVSYNWDREET
jgi:hypothetical protein